MRAHEDFAEVLVRAQMGESEGARQLWLRYSPAVARYARAKGSLEPDDLTSEVFLVIFRQLSEFTGDEASFRGYLFTIAHRRLVDEFRRRSRAPHSAEWSAETDPRSVHSAEDAVLTGLGTESAQALLDRITPDQRAVLLLRIFGDLTIEQVAEVLGKPIGAVKALQRRGLSALKRLYDSSAGGSAPWERSA